ncbi:hypothetical protein GS399_06900 [Pedobacter sp. HMF7647]|uniref:Uncharacterized protein n=1 Tax=Hufsiella arboris TaxID=2695275 RepID=A0A7K1Y804_9SPHI|nr:hypothetical protein [Hufsiella arboris]MXV50697.1 hypothetical protein [Hufsiella arboris]
MGEVLFYEKQQFKQWWLWLLLAAVSIYISINKYLNSVDFTYAAFTVGTVILLFLVIKLETKITRDGIYVRFFPFNIGYKFHSWNTISKAYVKEYRPLADYGGWGFRYSFINGRALNISGNKGLQLEFIDGSKLLIGTAKEKELEDTLMRLNP